MFSAIVIDKTDEGQSVTLQQLDEAQLPDGNVTIEVAYSTLISRMRMSSTMQPRQSGCHAARKSSAEGQARDSTLRVRNSQLRASRMASSSSTMWANGVARDGLMIG